MTYPHNYNFRRVTPEELLQMADEAIKHAEDSMGSLAALRDSLNVLFSCSDSGSEGVDSLRELSGHFGEALSSLEVARGELEHVKSYSSTLVEPVYATFDMMAGGGFK